MCSIPERKPLELYIGTNEAQNAVVYPLDQLPHLLVCGMNGCGRSSFLRAQTALLVHGASAEQLRLVLLDETGVEFVQFKELPHLLMPLVSAPEKKAGAMLALCMELQWRYSVFAKCGARELEDYNQQAEMPLPHIVAVIDGLEDLLAQKECVGQIQQICQKGRPVGIHIIAAARQVPEEEIVAGFASRLAFRVATKNAANRMGAPGAELLPIPGTALFSPINYANPVRVQTKELTDEEIETLIAPVATGHHYDDDFVREASRVESDEWPDPMYEYARQCVIEAGYASTSLLQRRCNLGYARAAHILDQLEQAKVIGPYEGAQPRVVLPPYAKPKAAPTAKGIKINRSTVKEASAPEEKLVQPPAEETPAQPLVPEIVETQPEVQRQVSTVQGCDGMEGHDFEHLCADALRANGYKQVQVTQASGDYGIDVLAQNNGISYAIQCKRYNSPVGNHAVQEAYAGAAYYGSSVPVVLTNQDFTPAAREMAASLGVKLWGRNELDDLLRVYESTEQRRKRMILKILKVVLKIALYAIGAAAVALLVVAAGIVVISAYAMVFAAILVFAPILVFFCPKKRRRRR
nr:MAG TPA: DNA TRANSLOCASE FTSK [Caudoviricetes sp.]